MRYKILRELIIKYNIPYSVKLLSDSGWECGATDMDAVYYNKTDNILVFTQSGNIGHTKYDDDPNWTLLHKKGE